MLSIKYLKYKKMQNYDPFKKTIFNLMKEEGSVYN